MRDRIFTGAIGGIVAGAVILTTMFAAGWTNDSQGATPKLCAGIAGYLDDWTNPERTPVDTTAHLNALLDAKIKACG